MGHITGIAIRLRLIAALVGGRTETWISEAGKALETIGYQYRTVSGNCNPFDFLRRIRDVAGPACAEAVPGFEDLDKYDFFAAAPDLDPLWRAELEVSRFLGELAFLTGARRVLESGCFVGVTTSYLARALRARGDERDLYFIDQERRFLELTMANLKALGLDGVNLHPLLGTTYDPELARQIAQPLDLIFLDSDHSYQGAVRELKVYLPKLSERGILVMHDSIYWSGVRKAIAEVVANHEIVTFGTSRGAGLSVILPPAGVHYSSMEM